MISAHRLRREFGARVAVDDVSLSVPAGTILALLGPNGAGKTTTVRMLAGLLAPTSGEAEVGGCDVRRHPAAVRACVGLVTDAPGLHDQMTPRAYLDFFGQVYGLEAPERGRRIDALLDVLDLRAVAGVRMARFSRGMQQKVALARALLHEPRVLFLDEPTASLDPLATRMVRDLIVRLKNANRSIILCTHDLDEAERLADTVAILRSGRIVACDTPRALRAGVSHGTLVQVQVSLASPCAAALPLLAETDGVVEPRLTPSQAAETELTYRTLDPRRTNPEVVARLVAAGAEVVSLASTTASLEDVFASALSADGVR
ncbi:MAG: ABC transporter ATP-binding protein [Chloroflexi bacterium]|nr:ABC transporter ATP-binding protein [Chloroflexota bacterium]